MRSLEAQASGLIGKIIKQNKNLTAIPNYLKANKRILALPQYARMAQLVRAPCL